MDEYIMVEYITGTITGIVEENADSTQYKARIGNTLWSGIHPDHRFWKDIQAAIAAGEPVKKFIAPPVPDPKIAALEASDMALIKAGARIFEDVINERISAGKVPEGVENQKMKDIISMRVNLRK
jgi:hypothetical protein